MRKSNWLEVDRKGLGKLARRQGLDFILRELLQNAWDQRVTRVDATIEKLGHGKGRIRVEDDDPQGFSDLDHAYTLFAESEKKSDPTKRGRFNLGEKLVLAVCDEAEVSSTTGSVRFDKYSGRKVLRRKREAGSVFEGTLRMNEEEYQSLMQTASLLIPPEGIETRINGELLAPRIPCGEFELALPTEIAASDGYLKRVIRKTKVSAYEPRDAEGTWLYELGIPVVETGDKFHVNVHQKVLLNMDRDNVPPAYLRKIRTAVFNTLYDRIGPEDANHEWVREATSDAECSLEAMTRALDLRFGERRVAYDPSDPEANKLAVSKGYVVVHGGQMSKAEWENVRRGDLILPAGKVTPSPKPFHPDGKPLKLVDPAQWTPGMNQIADYAGGLAQELLGMEINVQIADERAWPVAAAYGPSGDLTFNAGRLGKDWFDDGLSEKVDELLIHEFGHEYSRDHLSHEYHEALCRLGAKMRRLAYERPEFFRGHERRRE